MPRSIAACLSRALGLVILAGIACTASVASADAQTPSQSTDGVPPVAEIGYGAAAISLGSAHTCTLAAGGKVLCWGSNAYGQLGVSGPDRVLAVEVPGIVGSIAVSSGEVQTCAIVARGAVRCWGDNTNGQLGNGTNIHSIAPVAVLDLFGAVALSTGSGHSCAIVAGGDVYCWGANGMGELGDGTTTPRTRPVKVAGLSGVIQLDAGYAHTCALTVARSIYCWGNNHSGQLSLGAAINHSALPVLVGGLADVAQLSLGYAHTCAATVDGTAFCWGANGDGQLGNLDLWNHFVPTRVEGVVGAKALASGYSHSCALVEGGAMQCWGEGFAELVDDDAGGSNNHLPQFIPGVTTATTIAAGGVHTCVVLAARATRCWGANYAGQLGNGLAATSALPVTVQGSLGNIRKLVAGGSQSCALNASGFVYCWGGNIRGELGDGSFVSSRTPVQVVGLSGVTAINANFGNACASIAGGSLKCWGSNRGGQLASASMISSATPLTIPGVLGASAVAIGSGHMCALISGRLKCWGSNSSGQLGIGNFVATTTPVSVPGVVGAIAVVAGDAFTCALMGNGGIKCWGSWYGNLPADVPSVVGASAVSASSNYACVIMEGNTHCFGANLIAPSGITDANQIAVGYNHACARVSNGFVHCWGDNQLGQTGTLASLGPVSTVIAGVQHNCAITVAGLVKCWGNNMYGQLGNGGAAYYATPQPVVGAPFMPTYAVQASSNAGGSVSPARANVDHGFRAPFAVQPAYGYSIQSVSGCEGTLTGTTYTTAPMLAACNITASFVVSTYALHYATDGHGTIQGVGVQSITHGGNGTLVTAMPSPGYHFVQWSDGSSLNPRSEQNVVAPISVTAIFANDAPVLGAVASRTLLEDSDAVQIIVDISDRETAASDLRLITASLAPDLIANPVVDQATNQNQRLLTITPRRDANGGPATIRLELIDELGRSVSRQFDVHVSPVNDPPQLSAAGYALLHPLTGNGPQSAAGFLVFDPGPQDEAGQHATAYTVESIEDPQHLLQEGSFAIADNGTVSYILTGAEGRAGIDVHVRDDGGIANGGEDASRSLHFDILVSGGVDLQVAKSNQRSGLLDGDSTVYSIVVANAGPNAVAGVHVLDALPPTLINGSWICVPEQSTASCPDPAQGTGNLDARVGLGVDTFLRFDVMAEVDASAGALIVNTVHAIAPETVELLFPANDSATDADPVVPDGMFHAGFENLQPVLTVSGAEAAMSSIDSPEQ